MTYAFYGHDHFTVEQLIKIMSMDYQSLTVVILVNTFGLMLVVVGKGVTINIIVLVLLMEGIVLLLLLAMTTTVNQVQCIALVLPHITQ